MKTRAITSVVIVAVGILLAAFSEYIVYPIALAILAVIAITEIFKVMQSQKRLILLIPACLLAAAFPIAAYFVDKSETILFLLSLAAAMFVYMMWLMGAGVFSKGKISFTRTAELFMAVFYITISFTSLSMLRYLDRAVGLFVIVLVFAVAWLCDVFAFLVGSLFGKHKLIPEVSPKKTVEGAIGGIVFSTLLCLGYGFGVDMIVENISVNYLVIGVAGAVLSVVSQLGDLIASLIKREYGVKDYGKLFPGHGGVMDRFDSVIAVSTILLIICVVFPPFTFV